jgi:hypothetical protein
MLLTYFLQLLQLTKIESRACPAFITLVGLFSLGGQGRG